MKQDAVIHFFQGTSPSLSVSPIFDEKINEKDTEVEYKFD